MGEHHGPQGAGVAINYAGGMQQRFWVCIASREAGGNLPLARLPQDKQPQSLKPSTAKMGQQGQRCRPLDQVQGHTIQLSSHHAPARGRLKRAAQARVPRSYNCTALRAGPLDHDLQAGCRHTLLWLRGATDALP